MAINASEFIWHNGTIVPWQQAQVHVMSHVLHYGSSVFEGIRVYETPQGARGFRLTDHMRRLYDSAKIYHLPIPFECDELIQACHNIVGANQLRSAYLRPIAFRGYGGLGVAASPDTPTEVSIAAIEWGAYLGEESREQGVDVCVSSWQRVAPNTIPAGAKAGGNYLSSQLISMEAKRRGFAEGIGLATDGTLSEGAGENLFVIKDGRLFTPPQAASILAGITRDSVVKLAQSQGLEVVEQTLPREMLYLADEAFFTGTAAEITPIRSVDEIEISSGGGSAGRGPITKQIQDAFFGLFDGTTEDRWGWLEPISAQAESQALIREAPHAVAV